MATRCQGSESRLFVPNTERLKIRIDVNFGGDRHRWDQTDLAIIVSTATRRRATLTKRAFSRVVRKHWSPPWSGRSHPVTTRLGWSWHIVLIWLEKETGIGFNLFSHPIRLTGVSPNAKLVTTAQLGTARGRLRWGSNPTWVSLKLSRTTSDLSDSTALQRIQGTHSSFRARYFSRFWCDSPRCGSTVWILTHDKFCADTNCPGWTSIW